MLPFDLPTIQNFKFTGFAPNEERLPLLNIEEEISKIVDILNHRKGKYRKVRYTILYFESAYSTQYLLSTNIINDATKVWADISVSLFNLVSSSLKFSVTYSNGGSTLYASEYMTLSEVIKLLEKHSRKTFLDNIIKSL